MIGFRVVMADFPFLSGIQPDSGSNRAKGEAVCAHAVRVLRSDLAANSSFFEADANPGIFHQRRCSTADESGLQD